MYLIIPVICVAITVLVIELLSLNTVRKLTYRCEVNMSLTEPDEIATLTYRVYNTSSWPIMFVGFSFLFHDMVQVREDETWKAKHGTSGFMNNMYGRELYLMPHRGVKGTIAFSLKNRGVCESLGYVYLETGDFLGLKTSVISRELDIRMICTAKLSEHESDVRVIGGLLGEITTRRFICDDPSLVVGYREYSGHEPLKDISWNQTAKMSSLMVKTHDFTTDCDVTLLVDIELTDPKTVERCLSLTRTVCEYLEEQRIPYALRSNGDLFTVEKGAGRKHLFEIHRRIGISHFTKYSDFEHMMSQSAISQTGNHGYIVILPQHDLWIETCITQFGIRTNSAVCVLVSEEEDAA